MVRKSTSLICLVTLYGVCIDILVTQSITNEKSVTPEIFTDGHSSTDATTHITDDSFINSTRIPKIEKSIEPLVISNQTISDIDSRSKYEHLSTVPIEITEDSFTTISNADEATSYIPNITDDSESDTIFTQTTVINVKSDTSHSEGNVITTIASHIADTNNNVSLTTETSKDISVENENHSTAIFNNKSNYAEDRTISSSIDAPTTKLPSIRTQSINLDNCPSIRKVQVAGAVVKCHCHGNEILVNGECKKYTDETLLIPVQFDYFLTIEANVTDYMVTVQDVECDPTSQTYMEFMKDQFHLRPRGDIVLQKLAGRLEGQRLNNYCISHHLDDKLEQTLTLKACVPIPSIPRCCPHGFAMEDGSCKPARTPEILTPPINAKPFHSSVDWPNITNFLNPLDCKYMPVHTIPLYHKESNLVNLANGVANGWKPGVISTRRNYYNCPEYCVDGIEKSDGSVEYQTSFCYANPIKHYEEECGDGPCIPKCCNEGYSMDVNKFACVLDSNSTFNPPTIVALSSYRIIHGWPLCTPTSQTREIISIDRSGTLILKNRTFSSKEYCVDTFLNNDLREQNALACLAIISKWTEVRPILFPICNVISIIFLIITIAFHLLVPKLLTKGGVHQLFHAIALLIAYSTSFAVHVFGDIIYNHACMPIAIIMQFGYLTTFFWLNVMCLEIWRKIRRLKDFRPCKIYPTSYYMAYGWGIPSVICGITIIMQNYAPDHVPGLIKPYIGFSRCWFREDMGLLVYFYGPIAFLFFCNSLYLGLTYFNYKTMLRDHKETRKTLRDMGTRNNGSQKASSSMPMRQLADHVHDFKQKLKLFVLMAACWVTEVLSWKIEPIEIWALTDILNNLQGFFIFIILLSNRNKRRELEENQSLPFRLLRTFMNIPQAIKKVICKNGLSLSPVNSFTNSLRSKLTSSTIVSSFKSSFKQSSDASFNVNPSYPSVLRSVSEDYDKNGVVTISHTSLQGSKSLGHFVESPC